MQYQVFIQNPSAQTFLASVIGFPNLTANGITETEAINKLKGILDAQFKNGKMVTINVDLPSEGLSEGNDPWIDNIGVFQDDPTFDDFLLEVSAYRNEVDNS